MVEYLAGGRIQGSSSVGAVDTLGTAVNGTNSGTVTDNNTPFYGETSVAFDNNDAVHDLGTTSSFAGLVKEDFTVIFWAKAAAVGNGGAGSNNGWGSGSSSNTYAGNQGTILNCGQVSGNGSNQGFVISFDDEGSQEFYMWMGDGNGNVILNDVIGSNDVADTDNNWHLYMFHFDNTNSQVKIYRDGGSSAIQTTSYASQVSSTSATTYKKMFMGRQADDDGRYFIGSLADVSIWKRLVTTSEFNTLWGTFQDNTSTATNSVKGVRVDALSDESGLLAHWKLNDLNFTNSASVTDEKTTITNVPVGTRFEETDTRKIWRMSNGGTMSSLDEDFSSYSDQAAANASWVPTNDQAALRVDTSANVLKYEINSSYGSYPNVTNCNTLKDLGENAITGDFTLKFKFRILSNGNQINYNCSCIFGIFETTNVNDNGTNDSGIGIQPTFQSGDESIRFNVQYGYSNFNRTGNSFDSVLGADVDDYWVKIVRSGSTSTCYIYSDAYSTLMRPALSVHDDKGNALRYIGFKNYMRFNAGGGNYATFEVDDIELDLTPSWVEKGRK